MLSFISISYLPFLKGINRSVCVPMHIFVYGYVCLCLFISKSNLTGSFPILLFSFIIFSYMCCFLGEPSFFLYLCMPLFVLPYALLHFFFSLKDLFCLGLYEYLCIHLISSHVRAHFCAPKPAGLINPFKILRLKPVRTITEPSRTL